MGYYYKIFPVHISTIFKDSISNNIRLEIYLTRPSEKDLYNRHGFKEEQSDKRNVFGQGYIF